MSDISQITTTDGVAHKLADLAARGDIATKTAVSYGDDNVAQITLSNKSFAKDSNSRNEITIKNGVIDFEFTGSPVDNFRFQESTTIWEDLVTGIDPHANPIRMRFHTSSSGSTKIIYSDIILAYAEITDPANPTVKQHRFFSGTGVVYTGNTVGDCVYVAVRVDVQELNNDNNQYDIYVKELATK